MNQRIAAGIKALGLNRRKMAAALDTDPSIVTRIVAGTMPGTKHMEKIAEILQCSVVWLTTGRGEPPVWWVEPKSSESEGILPTLRAMAARLDDMSKRMDEMRKEVRELRERSGTGRFTRRHVG